jgi:hypothetical protein
MVHWVFKILWLPNGALGAESAPAGQYALRSQDALRSSGAPVFLVQLVFQRFIFPNFSVNVQVYLLLLVSLRI